MKILVLDVGNSKTKCYVFDIDTERKYYQTVDCIWSDQIQTPRCHPWDLLDACRVLLSEGVRCYKPEAGIITSFGDAFILNSQRKYVFADEPADAVPEYAYAIDGWPRNIQLSGIRALKAKHAVKWDDMYSINGWITTQLCYRPSDDPWHAWDITQASISACFNFQTQKWVANGDEEYPHIIPSSKQVGKFEGMPLLAGGLDNAFIDTTNPDPYIIAGTWLVIGNIAMPKKGKVKKKHWTQAAREAGVRWLLSGNGNYHKQIVRKVSNPITVSETEQILTDLDVLGVEPTLTGNRPESKKWFTPARVRVFGGYGSELADMLTEKTRRFHFYTPSQTPNRPDLYQHEQTAHYVYNEVSKWNTAKTS